VALLFCSSLGMIGIALDPTCFLGIHRAMTWRFLLPHRQDQSHDGALVVGGDLDPNLLELTVICRRGSSHGTGGSTLLVDLLLQPAAAVGVSCNLVIGARYVEQITASAELGLEVARRLLPPRLDLGGLGHLTGVGVAGWS
jgi:hypothetical protein